MELNMIFTSLVLVIGAFHLVAKTASFIQRYFFRTRSNVAGITRQVTPRDDWHLFFHCSDITGKKEEEKAIQGDSDGLTTNKKDTTQRIDRRKHARRLAC